jgi:hypothetical protein
MSSKHKTRRETAEQDHDSKPAREPKPVASPAATSPSAAQVDDGHQIASWQPIFVITAISIGILVLLAKVIGLF